MERKQTLKQFIFSKMEKNGFILDKEVADFLGKEPNYWTIELYKAEIKRLEFAKIRFKDFEDDPKAFIQEYKNSWKGARTKYTLSSDDLDNWHYKIPKNYFEYLKEKGVKVR